MSAAPHTVAPQPDLRAFIVYDHVPTGCVPFLVSNEDTMPLLRPGDIAIVDTEDRDPVHGDLFVIEYGKGSPTASRHLVETFLRPGRYGKAGSLFPSYTDAWFTGAYGRPRSREDFLTRLDDGRAARGGCMVDGPVSTDEDGVAYMRDRLVGRVIGIFEPRVEEPRRLTT